MERELRIKACSNGYLVVPHKEALSLSGVVCGDLDEVCSEVRRMLETKDKQVREIRDGR